MACSDGWTIATALGTIGATVSALSIAIWQRVNDQIVARKISRAIAPALIDDLVVVDKLMETVQSFMADAHDVRAANNAQIRQTLHLAYTLRAPAFDRFKELLPKLGTQTAPVVIAVYGQIVRTGEMVRAYTSQEGDIVVLSFIAESLKRNASTLQTSVQHAITLLRAV